MKSIQWEPFEELSILRKDMDNLWNRCFNDVSFPSVDSQKWLPSVYISETKDTLFIKAELPGMDAKDINVNISGNLLTIKGEKKNEKKDKYEYENHYCVEWYSRNYRPCQRVVQLPTDVQGDRVKASFDMGILKLTIPKVRAAKKKEIEIEVE